MLDDGDQDEAEAEFVAIVPKLKPQTDGDVLLTAAELAAQFGYPIDATMLFANSLAGDDSRESIHKNKSATLFIEDCLRDDPALRSRLRKDFPALRLAIAYTSGIRSANTAGTDVRLADNDDIVRLRRLSGDELPVLHHNNS